MPLVKVEEQVFSFLIFFNMVDIVGTTVASQRCPAGGKPMVGRRWQATEICHRLTINSLAVDRWWQFAVYSHWRTDGIVLSGIYLIYTIASRIKIYTNDFKTVVYVPRRFLVKHTEWYRQRMLHNHMYYYLYSVQCYIVVIG